MTKAVGTCFFNRLFLFFENCRLPGQYYDAETGLHYNWHRYYDPATGRYLTPDPIGLEGGINLYSYALQNPVNYIDPFGLDAFTFHVNVNIPFVGGVELGFVEFTGPGISNRDFGVYGKIKKHHGGLALAKTAVGISQTFGCRENFDGVDAETNIGLGKIGGSAGGLAKNQKPNSLSLEVGPQLGYEVNKTNTISLTVGDIARGVARIIYGDGGSIFDN